MNDRGVAFVFEAPWVLLLALPLGALAVLARRRAPAVSTVLPSGGLPVTPRLLAHRASALFGSLSALLLLVALAGPAVVEVTREVRRALDVVVVLDVSGSMRRRLAGDGRSRLDAAREEARRFVAGRRDDRVGLVTFARFADVWSAPTSDRRAVARMLDEVRPVDAGEGEDASAIGVALAQAGQLLLSSRAPRRVVVLVTDGRENVAGLEAPALLAPSSVASWLAEHGVVVHAVAVGGGDRPGGVEGAGGAGAKSAGEEGVDLDLLGRVTERTGGILRRARDADALAAVWREIDRLERGPVEEIRRSAVPRFEIALALAGLCAVAAFATRWLAGGSAP